MGNNRSAYALKKLKAEQKRAEEAAVVKAKKDTSTADKACSKKRVTKKSTPNDGEGPVTSLGKRKSRRLAEKFLESIEESIEEVQEVNNEDLEFVDDTSEEPGASKGSIHSRRSYDTSDTGLFSSNDSPEALVESAQCQKASVEKTMSAAPVKDNDYEYMLNSKK